MLAVIAIVVILLSLLMPVFKMARDSAAAVVCETNLHQVMVATNAYCTDNVSYMPFPNWGGWGQDLGGAWTLGGWLYYNKNNETWNTDAHWTPEKIRTGLIWEYHEKPEVYRCPKDVPPWPILSGQVSSYNMNGSICGYGENLTFRRFQFRPTDFIYWEVDPYIVQAGWWWDGANHPDEGISTVWHQQGGTLVALDGHCEWMQYSDYAAEKAISTRNKLWNAPNTANGH